MKRPIIVTDCSLDQKQRWAGIAVADRGGMLMAADVVPCITSNEGEALAILRALDIAQHARKQARVWTDSAAVWGSINGQRDISESRERELFERIVFECEVNNHRVELVDRRLTLAAHIAARQVRKGYEAGMQHRFTYEPEVMAAA